MKFAPIVTSILDTDLYKLTMQQAYLFGSLGGIPFADIEVEYSFFNRGKTPMPSGFAEAFMEQLEAMHGLCITDQELQALEKSTTFFRPAYLEWLRGFRLNTEEVMPTIHGDGDFKLKIKAPVVRGTWWEVPLMAITCELYHALKGETIEGPFEMAAAHKGEEFKEAQAYVIEFGTRRRHSKAVHRRVLNALGRGAGEYLVGTSNVQLALDQRRKMRGTVAHEWFMFIAALFGYPFANRLALELWDHQYRGQLGIALTDTFTSDLFFRNFDLGLASRYDGLRHDSGDPYAFAEKAITHYENLGIDPMSKMIVFSDSLTTEKAIEIARWCRGKVKCSFGIGTHFTNDIGYDPLNIVIKMTRCNGIPTVKISDVMGKTTSEDIKAVDYCLHMLGLARME